MTAPTPLSSSTLPSTSITATSKIPRCAIYHGFDDTYENLTTLLPNLHAVGFDAIQTSPPHRFRTDLPHNVDPTTTPNNVWWLAYQPVSYDIYNRYGNAESLKTLCDDAHRLGMKVIVDVCLNFMAALPGLESTEWTNAEKPGNEDLLASYWDRLDKAYPPFTRDDYLPRFSSKSSKSNWFSGSLPGLRLNSPKVREVHFQYLHQLSNEVGVDGFRIDAALYQTPETLQLYLSQFPNVWIYFEIFEKNRVERVEPYRTLRCSLEEFFPTMTLIEAINGALGPSSWKKPGFELLFSSSKKNFDGQTTDSVVRLHHDVTFALNHDTYSNMSDQKHGISGMKFDRVSSTDPRRRVEPWDVGHAVLFAIKKGIPLILNRLADSSVVEAGVRFRNKMVEVDAPYSSFPGVVDRCGVGSVSIRRTFLWLRRGDEGWLVCNLGLQPVHVVGLKESQGQSKLIFKAINSSVFVRLSSSFEGVNVQSVKVGDTVWEDGILLDAGALLFFVRASLEDLKGLNALDGPCSQQQQQTKIRSSSSHSRVQGAGWATKS